MARFTLNHEEVMQIINDHVADGPIGKAFQGAKPEMRIVDERGNEISADGIDCTYVIEAKTLYN